MRWSFLTLAVPLAAGVVVAGGCGSSDNNSDTTATRAAKPAKTSTASGGATAGGGSKLTLAADPGGALKFDRSKLKAKSGNVTITMDNPSDVPHAVAVEGNGVDKDGPTVTKGGKSEVSVSLKPGTYEFYCPVDSHKQQGMEGTLTVT
jgi:plastocyanin